MTADVRYTIPTALPELRSQRLNIIEASAGTGKTYLIEHRLVDLILSGTPVEHILVVTFTDKATAELKHRVRALLMRLSMLSEPPDAQQPETQHNDTPHWLIGDAQRTMLRRAVLNFEQAPIFTIHGFCNRVLREHAFASNRQFQETQVSGEVAFSDAFKHALRREFARHPQYTEYLVQWLRSGRTVDSLEKLLYRCAQQPGHFSPPFDPQKLQKILVDGSTQFPSNHAEISDILTPAQIHPSTGRAIATRLSTLSTLLHEFAGHGELPRFVAQLDQATPAVFPYLADKLSTAQGTSTALDQLITYVTELNRLAVSLPSAVVQQFSHVMAEYVHGDKLRRGLVDYSDMLRLVCDGLYGPRGDELTQTLRDRYPHALIDEFQDTDELQWRIFRRLYVTNSDTGSLTIIGDPKQAIYGFRGADVYTYLDAKQQLVQQGTTPVYLTNNYRSTARVVDAYNNILTQSTPFEAPFFGDDIGYEHPVAAASELTASYDDNAPAAAIHLLRLHARDGKPRSEAIRDALRRAIVERITALLTPRRGCRLLVRNGDAHRRTTARDIFVLTRTLAESYQMSEALGRAGVACSLYKQEGLFQTDEATEVRDLLAGIAQPGNRAARFRAWQTRFFGVKLADLPNLTELADSHPLVERLYEWKSIADSLNYERLFQDIVSQTKLCPREIFLDPSNRALTNILHILDLLTEEASRSRCGLVELTRRLQIRIERATSTWGDNDDSGNTQRTTTDGDAVQIMTIHKAKGLEADVVFLYGGLSSRPRHDLHVFHKNRKRLVQLGQLSDEDKAQWTREMQDEDQRLYYVAMTRARAQMFLPVVATKSPRLGSYRAMNDRLTRVVEELANPNAVAHRNFVVENVLIDESETPYRPPVQVAPLTGMSNTSGLETWSPPAHLLAPARSDHTPTITSEQLRGFSITSYTRLKANRLDTPADHTATTVSDQDLPAGPQSGLFVHHVLEHISAQTFRETPDFDEWASRSDISRLFEQARVLYDRKPEHVAPAMDMVFSAFTTSVPLSETNVRIADSDNQSRELGFLYPVTGSHNGLYVEGFIDLVFEHKGVVYVVDWKTDVLPQYDEDELARHTQAHYALQAKVYALAIARMLHVTDEASYQQCFGGALYWFLRGHRDGSRGIHFVHPDYSDLQQFEQTLAHTHTADNGVMP